MCIQYMQCDAVDFYLALHAVTDVPLRHSITLEYWGNVLLPSLSDIDAIAAILRNLAGQIAMDQ